ncbi:MAG: hypothetical protein LAP87_20005 [Acidobacteriia bacterium]|nr:hypothetical protein [Terriglobia bacterium]
MDMERFIQLFADFLALVYQQDTRSIKGGSCLPTITQVSAIRERSG